MIRKNYYVNSHNKKKNHFSMAICECPVVKQENGFYLPKLMTGEKRELRIPSEKPTPPTDLHDITLTARPIPLLDAFTCEEFLKSPILTDLLTSQKVNLSDVSKTIITNTNGGGILQFGALKVVKNYQSYHALQVIGTMTPGGSEDRKPVFAYWLPPGGYVDIPRVPNEDDPKFVFTPTFNGGSLVADVHNASTLRIHNVAGGKENNEHENDGDEEHGFSSAFGMAGRLLHSDYGFHVNVDTCKYVEHGNAFAFVKFDSGIQHWVITFQGILHNPVIDEISFAQRNNWKVKTKFSSSTKIVLVDSKILGTYTDYKGKTVENQCFFGKVLEK